MIQSWKAWAYQPWAGYNEKVLGFGQQISRLTEYCLRLKYVCLHSQSRRWALTSSNTLFLPLVLIIIFTSMSFPSSSSSRSPYAHLKNFLQKPKRLSSILGLPSPSWTPQQDCLLICTKHLTSFPFDSFLPGVYHSLWRQMILRAEEPQAVGKSGNFEGRRDIVKYMQKVRRNSQCTSPYGGSLGWLEIWCKWEEVRKKLTSPDSFTQTVLKYNFKSFKKIYEKC